MRARADTAPGAGLLASAVALRWSRPDLTAAIAQHVAETWADDDRSWIAAVGWLVHGRAAIGDGREPASDALAEVARRVPGLLDDPAADRLRIEVAVLAAGQREPATARQLVGPVLADDDRPADVRADALGVLARCMLEERPMAIAEASRRAQAAWGSVGGADAEIAAAALALVSAAASRRSGHPDVAVDRAAEGLARLDNVSAGPAGTPSPHLAAALSAEWITAMVEAGLADDAREGCTLMSAHLHRSGRPTRQVALLRLTMARALAGSTSAGAFEALEQAAKDAAECDTPDLEGLCLSTLGALREQAGRLDAALESMRRGVAAQRRDRARSERFRAALRALVLPPQRARAERTVVERQGRDVTAASGRPVPATAAASDPEPAHPLAWASASGPWTTGRWTSEPVVAAAGEWGTSPAGRTDASRCCRARASPRDRGQAGRATPPDGCGRARDRRVERAARPRRTA